ARRGFSLGHRGRVQPPGGALWKHHGSARPGTGIRRALPLRSVRHVAPAGRHRVVKRPSGSATRTSSRSGASNTPREARVLRRVGDTPAAAGGRPRSPHVLVASSALLSHVIGTAVESPGFERPRLRDPTRADDARWARTFARADSGRPTRLFGTPPGRLSPFRKAP